MDVLQAWVKFIQGEDDAGRRLVVLPAFETLPYKSSGNAAEDAVTNQVADFAAAADKQALKVGRVFVSLAVWNKYSTCALDDGCDVDSYIP